MGMLISRKGGAPRKEIDENGCLQCSKCKQNLPVTAYCKNKSQKTGYNYACKQCMRPYTRKHNLPKKYGITEEQYVSKFQAQAGKCACCKVDISNSDASHTSRPHLDHNHQTGQVRDILCGRCNLAAGNVLDSSERAKMLFEYLVKWNC